MRGMPVFVSAVVAVLCVGGVCGQEKPSAEAGKTVKAVRFGKLWDAKGKLWTNAIVIVEGDRIRAVTTNAVAIPAQAEVIDLSKYTGLPGLIDVHTHMTMYTDETPGEPMLKQLTSNPPAVEVFLARKGGRRTGSFESGAAADRGWRGCDQDVRIDGNRRRRDGIPDVHARGNEGSRGNGAPVREKDCDSLVRAGRCPRCGARGNRFVGARHG